MFQSAPEPLGAHAARRKGRRRRSDRMHPARPERLVEAERDHDLRDAGVERGAGAVGAAVVDERGRAREQPVVRRAREREHVRSGRRIEAAPARQEHRAPADGAGRGDDVARERTGVLADDAREAGDDRRSAGRNERGQLWTPGVTVECETDMSSASLHIAPAIAAEAGRCRAIAPAREKLAKGRRLVRAFDHMFG